MGFALWVNHDLAWAAGTSEYRAMGAAVVSRTDLFRAADFRAWRRVPAALNFAGNFASLGQINAWLLKTRAWAGPGSRVRPARSAAALQSRVNPRRRKDHAANRKNTRA